MATNPPPDLRLARLEQGMTMKGLAERCTAVGVRVSTAELSRIERRIHSPRPALRKMLAEQLGLSVTDFDEPDTDV